MPFEKNDDRINREGRPRGSKNKITEEIRAAFQMVLENRLPDLEKWIMQTAQEDPAKAVDLMLKLSNRFLPELSRTEMTGANGDDLFKSLKFNFGTEPEEEDGE